MDSLTQIVLGAGVGVAVLGRRLGPRRAAIAGGLLGTLPDLDVLVRFDDPVDAFIGHRGFSHSLLVQAAVTPLLGEAMVRFIKVLRQQRPLAYLAVYLCLATHALLAGLPIYGTKLLWPLSMEPYAVGSVFIIDALYTLPLLVAMIWALCLAKWSRRIGTVTTTVLILSATYQVWCLAAQQIVSARADAMLEQAGIRPEKMLAIPTPFNSYLWRVVVMDGERYLNLYMPVLGSAAHTTVYEHPRGRALASCLEGNPNLEKLAWFSRGYYRLDRRGDNIVVSDLRMGLTPRYVFQYAIARHGAGGGQAIPPRRLNGPRGTWADIEWLLANISHDPARRVAEAGAWLHTADLSRSAKSQAAVC